MSAEDIQIIQRLAIVETKLDDIKEDYQELKGKLSILNGNVRQLDNFKTRLIGLAVGISMIVGLIFNMVGLLWR